MELSTKEKEELAQLENDLNLLDKDDKSGDYPKPPDKDSVFKFFRELINKLDSSKISNLALTELGNLKLTVRDYQDVAGFCYCMGLNQAGDYLTRKGEIILSTSLSKKGFLAQLFVTQIKREKKDRPPQQKSGGLFNFGGTPPPEDID